MYTQRVAGRLALLWQECDFGDSPFGECVIHREPALMEAGDGRGLAGGRASLQRRTEILSVEPSCRHADRGRRRRHQGALGLRTGASATQGGTRPRPFLDRAASTRSHDNDRLRLPPNKKARSGGTEKRVSDPPPQPRLPAVRQAILDRFSRPPPHHCPHCGGTLPANISHFCQSSARRRGQNRFAVFCRDASC